MVQKSVACGIELLVAISAATDLAVNMAEQCNLPLSALLAKEKRISMQEKSDWF